MSHVIRHTYTTHKTRKEAGCSGLIGQPARVIDELAQARQQGGFCSCPPRGKWIVVGLLVGDGLDFVVLLLA